MAMAMGGVRRVGVGGLSRKDEMGVGSDERRRDGIGMLNVVVWVKKKKEKKKNYVFCDSGTVKISISITHENFL